MKQFTIGRMRVVLLIATVGAILIAGAGSTLASEGQQLCIGGSHAAVKPAANGICPQSGELVTLAKQTEDSGLPARVSELESKTTRLDGEVSMLKDKVAELEQKLSKISYEPKGLNDLPTVKISGANLQVINGADHTTRRNGVGNLILGYDEHAADIKQTGSHNLVLGDRQMFTSWGGLLAGQQNSLTAPSGVAFGSSNKVEGQYGTVTGGNLNVAGGLWSSISGGAQGVAKGPVSSISGGQFNTTEGSYASVSGGLSNFARGDYSSMSGGIRSTARGMGSSLSGGEGNDATGDASSILGGHDIVVNDKYGTNP